MDKQYARYMKWGKSVQVQQSGEVYKLVEDMNSEKDTVLAVNENDVQRFNLLTAWIRNWEGDTSGTDFRKRFTGNVDNCKVERQGYIEELMIINVMPHNKIRFITPDYQRLFDIKDLDDILLNGEPQKVAYIDETHFTFVGKSLALYGGCFHICQFAEICVRNCHKIQPSKPTEVNKEFLKLRTYKELWAVDYESPALGMTLKMESDRSVAQEVLAKLKDLADDEFLDILTCPERVETILNI